MENTTNVAATITEETFNNALAAAEAALTEPVVNYGDQIAKESFNSGKSIGSVEGFFIGGITVIAGMAIIKLIGKIRAAKKVETEEIEEVKEDEE